MLRLKGGLQKTYLLLLTRQNQIQPSFNRAMFSSPYDEDNHKGEGRGVKQMFVKNEYTTKQPRAYTPRRGSQQSDQQRQPQQQTKSSSENNTHYSDEEMIAKYGKTKSDLLDSWLEMDAKALEVECGRLGIIPKAKHIDNIQSLFEHLKKVETEIENSSSQRKSPPRRQRVDVEQQHIAEDKHTPHQQSQYNASQQYQHNRHTGSETNSYKKSSMFNADKKEHQSPPQAGPTQSQPSLSEKSAGGQSIGFTSREQKPFYQDQEKTRMNLNEQLNRILSKRRGTQPMFTPTQEAPKAEAEPESSVAAAEQSFEIKNPFHFSLGSLQESIAQRGDIAIDTASQKFTPNNSDSASIDKIFDMPSEQLDAHFLGIKQQSMFAEMDLKQEDFAKLTNITKKKVLINMTGVKNSIAINPNNMVTEDFKQGKFSQFVEFTKDNMLLLNKQSKEVLAQQLSMYIDKGLTYLHSQLVGNPSLQLDTINVAKSLLQPDQLKSFTNHLQSVFLNTSEAKIGDSSLQDIITYAKVVKFLVEQPDHLPNHINSHFFMGAKKQLSKRNVVKQLSFEDQIVVLQGLQKYEADQSLALKTAIYTVLNEIVSPGPNHAEKWESLSKDQVFYLVDRCMELSDCRDINNKLRGSLINIKTYTFSIDDFRNLFEKLLTKGFNGMQGSIDVKLLSNLFFRRNAKTAFNLINTSDKSQLKKHIDFFSFLYKYNPVIFSYMPSDIKLLLGRTTQLAEEQEVPLNELVRFSKIIIPHLFKPVILFKDMIQNTTESFKKDVDPVDLHEFVTEIVKRAEDGAFSFEHLQLSASRIHRNFKSFNEQTIFLLQRIIKDIVAKADEPISDGHMRVLCKALSSKQIASCLFNSSQEADSQLTEVLKSMLSQMDNQIAKLQNKSDATLPQGNINFEEWIERFQALSQIALLTDSTFSGDMIPTNLIDQVSSSAFNLMKLELLRSNMFSHSSQSEGGVNSPIDSILKLNKTVLEFFDQVGFMPQLYQDSPIRDIVTVVIEAHFLKKKPFVLSFEKFKKNIKITKMIQQETNKALILSNSSEIVHFMLYSKQIEGSKKIVEKLCKLLMPQSRQIVGHDLVNLFKLVDEYSILDQFRPLLINVAPNLATIGSHKIIDHKLTLSEDAKFNKINEAIEKRDLSNQQLILKKYESISHQQGDLLKKPEASLNPLSYIMAQAFDNYSDEDVLKSLEILGTTKVENYHADLIKALYDRYSVQSTVDNLAQSNPKLFIKLAQNWPHFLKNNAILNQLISMGSQQTTLTKQQSEILQILTRMNVLHPDLIELHLETFMKMKDREKVSEYLREFLNCSATLGYTAISPADMQKITALFRRLHKTPEQVPEISQLLNFLAVLSLQKNTYYPDFEPKNVEFIEAALNLVEKKFTGQEQIEVALPAHSVSGEPSEEKVKLSYFKSIPTHSKIYNKVLLDQSNFLSKFNFPKVGIDLKIIDDPELIKIQDIEEEEGEEQEDESAHIEEERLLVNAGKKPKSQRVEVGANEDEDIPSLIKDESDSALTEPHQDFIMRDEDIDAELHAAVQREHQMPSSPNFNKKEKKIYERKSSDSMYSEELEFHQYRKKKLKDLDKKSKHLMLFCNSNSMNFVDMNQSDLVKAWVVLFHFRSKTFNSMIYEEFESIAMRNTSGKSKGHELFSRFYLKLVEKSYVNGFRMHLSTKCEKTGWPIDISIHQQFDKDNIDPNTQIKKLALYFLLQEEVCLNAKEQTEEPLGVQKLMLRHLQTISDYKVEFVTENDFYMNKDYIDNFIEHLLETKLAAMVSKQPQ